MVPKAFEAGYPNATGFRKVVKATIYIKKKEGMSDSDFIEYYNNRHAQAAVPILQRHGIISYSLVIRPPHFYLILTLPLLPRVPGLFTAVQFSMPVYCFTLAMASHSARTKLPAICLCPT